jgi:hypothetical protein
MSRKIKLASFLGAALLFGWLSLPLGAQAASTCTPTMKVQETKESYVKLKVTCADLKSTKVTMKILVSNDDTDTDSYKKVTATLGKKGSLSLKIKNLDSSTSYSFKVKMKKASSSSYSSYSSSASTTTKGSDYEPEIDKINGLTEDSAKMNISCDDLENEAVSVQVAYKKKTTWSIKTFTLTLDDDGESSITVDGLKSDTLYNFKIRIKKASDSSYSTYSSVKTATTDED